MLSSQHFVILLLLSQKFHPSIAFISSTGRYCPLSIEVEKVYAYKNSSYTSNFTKNSTELIERFSDDDDGGGGADVQMFEVKQCNCPGFDDRYCVLFNGDENTCSIMKRWDTIDGSGITYCYTVNKDMTSFLKLFWFPSLVFFMFVILVPFATVMGRNAIEYAISPCFPYFRKRRIDRILRNEVDSISEHFIVDNDIMVEKTVLKLKTKTVGEGVIPFDGEEEEEEDDDGNANASCMICMEEIDKGERIGDLSCGHGYHVDCLKEWLKRRNCCPLCNTQVAKPQTVLVERQETFGNDTDDDVDDDNDDYGEAQSRLNRLLMYYHRRTTRRMQTSIT